MAFRIKDRKEANTRKKKAGIQHFLNDLYVDFEKKDGLFKVLKGL